LGSPRNKPIRSFLTQKEERGHRLQPSLIQVSSELSKSSVICSLPGINFTIGTTACVDDDDEEAALSFYTAKDTPPYTFQRLPGGTFSESGEASIDVNHFTLFTVFGKKPLKYAICTYYVPKQLNIHEAHITVTLKKELLMEVKV
jgi:hypothetical protein